MKYILVIILFSFACEGWGQSYFEVNLTPGLGYRSIAPKSGTDESFKDSINQIDGIRQNWGTGLTYVHGFNRVLKLQIGLHYRRLSFARELEDLQFHDTVHPAVGRIEDLSLNGQKNAYFYHQYHYLSFPVLIQKFIGSEIAHNKITSHLIAGLSGDVLINDGIKVFLQGYTVKGKGEHKIDNDYKANPFGINLILGGRFQIPIGPGMHFNLQPNFTYPILQTSSDEFVRMRLYQLNVQAGVSFEI